MVGNNDRGSVATDAFWVRLESQSAEEVEMQRLYAVITINIHRAAESRARIGQCANISVVIAHINDVASLKRDRGISFASFWIGVTRINNFVDL